MIIKPYSSIAAEAFNADDFPALKHFWPAKHGAIAAFGKLLDVVGGAHATWTDGGTVSGNGILMGGQSDAATDVALNAPGTSSCLLIACATWGATTSGFVYGATSATAGGLSVGNANAGAKLFDGAATKTASGTQTGEATFTRVATIRSVGTTPTELMMFETNSTTLDVYTNVSDLTAATAITKVDAVTQSIGLPTVQVTFFGAAFFKFSGELPPKEVIQAAAAWCHYQWQNNSNITMYPGLKGYA